MVDREGRIRVAIDGHVVGRRQTGNETYVVTLARGLAACRDVDPTIYVDRGVRWPSPPSPRLRRLVSPNRLLRIPFELPIRATRWSTDVLHVQYVAPPLVSVPVVTTVHDVSFVDEPALFPPATRRALTAAVALSVRRSAVVLAPSAFTRDRIVQHYDVDPARVLVTPIGIDAPRPATRDVGATQLAELGLPRRFVLAVGQLTTRKNLPRLIAAVARLRDGGVDIGLVLAGRRALGAVEVDAAMEEHRARGWTQTIGHVRDAAIAGLYAAADVVAYPSLYEGFGLPVLEAMAAGAPVVATNRGAVPEVAGGAVVLVDPLDVAAIADGLARVVTDDGLRRELAANGRERAASFTVERFVAATVDGYRMALGKSDSPRKAR